MTARAIIWVCAVAPLIGCADISDTIAGGLANIAPRTSATGDGIRTLSLLGGDVRVRGPEGYCIDQDASNARRGFVVMAGCALLSQDVAVMPDLDGLITVQFADADTASVAGNEEAFADFLTSDLGRATLASDGDLSLMSEVATVIDRGGVLARFEDLSTPSFAGTTGPQWRGFMDINGRLVTVSALSFSRAPLSRGQGERLLAVTMAELAAINAP